jgi:hypothetical protein
MLRDTTHDHSSAYAAFKKDYQRVIDAHDVLVGTF